MKKILIFGGYGIFGSHICRELSSLGFSLTIAGRSLEKASAFAQELGEPHQGICADAMQLHSYRNILAQHFLVVNCAGPFSEKVPPLLHACLEAGCHYVDIADHRGHVVAVKTFHELFQARGLCALYGCSSLPAISGALALFLLSEKKEKNKALLKSRSTLFIGNNNPKGSAAVRSALEVLGKRIKTPQGNLYGFRRRAVVHLPPPFGRRAVYAFESPEYDLFPALLGVKQVEVYVGFELRLATEAFHFASYLPKVVRSVAKKVIHQTRQISIPLGCSGGAVMTELFWENGESRSASISSSKDGQVMAVLPCVFAVQLLSTKTCPSGVWTAYELQGPKALLQYLVQYGFQMEAHPRSPLSLLNLPLSSEPKKRRENEGRGIFSDQSR